MHLEQLTREHIAQWRAGETLLLSGRILTARDAAHQRIAELARSGAPLPVNFDGRALYYVGPAPAVGAEAVGPAGPTSSYRMDTYSELMLGTCGVSLMIGKAERGADTVESIRRHRAAYLTAVGGAAYLLSKAIKRARVLAFEDLGMEAIYEFEVEDMPVTVAVDSRGVSIHEQGPKGWQRLQPPASAAR